MRKYFVFVSLFAILAMALASCTPPAAPTEAAQPQQEAPAEAAQPAPTDAPATAEKQQIEILGPWGGLEEEALLKVITPFEEETGIEVNYTGTRDVSVVKSRAEAGNPPDFYISPLPSVTSEFAKGGKLVALDSFMDMDALKEAYGQSWIDLATTDSHLYGIFGPVSIKSIVWYSPTNFAANGYEIPETWEEMLALSEKIAADGTTPWSIAMGSGDATGWVGTDWVEDIMLRTVEPEVYDQWVNHEISWLDPRVKAAWETFGEIGLSEAYVFGGTSAELATDFGDGADAVYTNPPNAYMHRQALFLYDFVRKHFPDLKPETDIDFFMLPPIDPAQGNPALAAGEMLIQFKDTPANQQFMEYWAGVEAQKAIVQHFGRLSGNKNVEGDVYGDPLLRKGAEFLKNANTVRFDGSDLMPSAIGAGAFWTGVVDYVSGTDLDTVLQNIEDASIDAYKK